MFERKRWLPLCEADEVSMPQSGSPAYWDEKIQCLAFHSSASSEKTTPVPGGGAEVTVRLQVAQRPVAPPVPVKVSVELPAAALEAAAMVTASLPEPETLDEANVTVTPDGAPETESATSPEKPLLAPTESVVLADAPAWIEAEPGETETLKSG